MGHWGKRDGSFILPHTKTYQSTPRPKIKLNINLLFESFYLVANDHTDREKGSKKH
ncbi:hypothetical protein F9C07_277 [Aspergillus flavus]|uniref:Uncharacterized protein n=1 Tax=Aspergillus flavus (strain ATCC 200026 / FGSC A1120 / IAM 13836 / NRRL 3357 / JCM 12722 / SRRC 167) TaxID=332952 RepID=A0A7U2MP58_ASPFN|nr:hypothetical protein F9C07_277 [Aspergillus flavus]